MIGFFRACVNTIAPIDRPAARRTRSVFFRHRTNVNRIARQKLPKVLFFRAYNARAEQCKETGSVAGQFLLLEIRSMQASPVPVVFQQCKGSACSSAALSRMILLRGTSGGG